MIIVSRVQSIQLAQGWLGDLHHVVTHRPFVPNHFLNFHSIKAAVLQTCLNAPNFLPFKGFFSTLNFSLWYGHTNLLLRQKDSLTCSIVISSVLCSVYRCIKWGRAYIWRSLRGDKHRENPLLPSSFQFLGPLYSIMIWSSKKHWQSQ